MNVLSRRPLLITAGVLLGLLGGALAERRQSMMVILCIAFVAVLALSMLGERAFPWAIVIVSVIPWYPFTAHSAAPAGIKQKAVCAAVAAAPLAPWLWSLAFGGRRTRASRGPFLMGLLFGCLTLLILVTLGTVTKMITPLVVGFLFEGFAFLCARRFIDLRAWLAAGFTGLVVLLLLGTEAAVTAPGERVGYFAGYPITYGALVVGLLPLGLVFAYRRSRGLAAVIAAASATLLILSESRSSWIAVGVVALVLVALLVRRGDVKALAIVAVAAAVVIGLLAGNSSLSKVVEQRLSTKELASVSTTHRTWSYSYAMGQIGQSPLFGAGAPGFAAEEAANRTSIGAIDNGYLSITVDVGLVGLVAALIPIGVAVLVLVRCGRAGIAPPLELALALGIVGIAVVTAFYDSFYWAQLDLLLGAMGGVLSVRVGPLGRRGPTANAV